MQFEDEALKISMQQSIYAKKERTANQFKLKRPFSKEEENILIKGLKESELNNVED